MNSGNHIKMQNSVIFVMLEVKNIVKSEIILVFKSIFLVS